MAEVPTDADGTAVHNSNSAALHLIDQYIEDGLLTPAMASSYKEKYTKLSSFVLETYKREKELLKKAKQLNGELLSEKIRLEKQSIRKSEEIAMNTNLEKEKEKAAKELADCMDRETILTYEITELQREHAELLARKEEMLAENARQVEPQVRKITEEIARFGEEAARAEADIHKEERRKQELTARCEVLRIANDALDASNNAEKKVLAKIRGDPERISKQADVVAKAVENLENEIKRINERLDIVNTQLEDLENKRKEAEDIQKELNHKLDVHRDTIDQRQRDVDHVNLLLNEEKQTHIVRLGEKARLELELRNADLNVRRESDRQGWLTKEFDRLKKLLKKKTMLYDSAKSLLPNMQVQVSDAQHQVRAVQAENKKMATEQVDLKQDVDVLIARLFKLDTIEKTKVHELEELTQRVKRYEEELTQWISEEAKQQKIISLLSAQREMKARAASTAIDNEKETQQELKMKELVILDFAKKCNETNNRLKEFSALYDIVKNERNKYVNLIQASSQALAEMKEKIKILHNEVEVLRNESLAKDKALTKEKLAHQTAQCSRDSLRLDTNKCHELYRTKQEQVEQQIVQIDKLNSIINMTEKEMLRLKKKYEIAVEARNSTGVELIDRNDELCILYEKCNIQAKTLTDGELAIQEKEQQSRMLHIKLLDVERQIETMRKKVPLVPEYSSKVLDIQNQLKQERLVTEMMCRDLETPKNTERWRALEGDDPDDEQLSAKLAFLEERFNVKKEQLLEKELVLEEVTNLSDKLRAQAADGRGDTLQLAKKVNTFQMKIKDTTRKMMATVSELSMFQATAMKLQQEKHDHQLEYEQSVLNFENGRPPNVKCEQEWYRIESSRLAKEYKRATQNNTLLIPTQITRTTAEPRPNAYVPDELGIPKPYGSLAPFKPTMTGSTMRHIRQPQRRDIEI
ncbi:MBO2, coiled coil flagellar protein [Thraustotheca clavata]|uniref:MBO2, coiled coil flagellar protein n=1 Tax=Thraustotheca clavata TaxID=74557 RepID=A0A1V9Z2P3_9STRA|nr:MBO2, coiled coil flagellar protein [Thraustotheca clavata]